MEEREVDAGEVERKAVGERRKSSDQDLSEWVGVEDSASTECS